MKKTSSSGGPLGIRSDFVLYVVLLLVTLLNPAFALEIPSNTWINLNPSGDPSAVPDTGNWAGKPAGRAWFPLEYHPNIQKTVLFGGGVTSGCNAGYINDVWAYDFPTNSWMQLRPSDPSLSWPSGMDNHVMSYDSINDRLWIFGGTCSGGFGYYEAATNRFVRVQKPNAHHEGTLDPGFAFGDGKILVFSGEPAWEYNPGERTSFFDVATQTWTDAKPSPAPPPRQQIEEVMVYDSLHKKFVLFGGQDIAGRPDFGDTWEYDLATNSWTKITPPVSPPSRQMHAMVYDSLHRVVILHGGSSNGSVLADTWIYDVGQKTWTRVATNGPRLMLHGLAYDRVNDVVILFGGAVQGGSTERNDTYAFRYRPTAADANPPGSPSKLTVR